MSKMTALSPELCEKVTGGQIQWLPNIISGVTGYIIGLAGDSAINAALSPSQSAELASRYAPQPGQTQTKIGDGTVIIQPDGQIWEDVDGDGDWDLRLWENPLDNDGIIDSVWDEQNNRWRIYDPGHVGSMNLTPTTVSGD